MTLKATMAEHTPALRQLERILYVLPMAERDGGVREKPWHAEGIAGRTDRGVAFGEWLVY